jgi:hypothetical protein
MMSSCVTRMMPSARPIWSCTMHERKSILIPSADKCNITCVIYLSISFNLVYSMGTPRFVLEQAVASRAYLPHVIVTECDECRTCTSKYEEQKNVL